MWSVKLAARHPFFSSKVTAFVIQCQECWSWPPRHASYMLTTSMGGTVALLLPTDPLMHPAGADLLQKEGHTTVVKSAWQEQRQLPQGVLVLLTPIDS